MEILGVMSNIHEWKKCDVKSKCNKEKGMLFGEIKGEERNKELRGKKKQQQTLYSLSD